MQDDVFARPHRFQQTPNQNFPNVYSGNIYSGYQQQQQGRNLDNTSLALTSMHTPTPGPSTIATKPPGFQNMVGYNNMMTSAAVGGGGGGNTSTNLHHSSLTNSNYYTDNDYMMSSMSSPYSSPISPKNLHRASMNMNPTTTKSVMKPPESADGYIYQIHFKRAHRNFLMSYNAMVSTNGPIHIGDFVKVEADRGEDMGVIISKVPSANFTETIPTAGYRGRGFSSGQTDKKFILRLATLEERRSLIEKVRDEEKALEVIRHKVIENRHPMEILDAEYQYDRHKVSNSDSTVIVLFSSSCSTLSLSSITNLIRHITIIVIIIIYL